MPTFRGLVEEAPGGGGSWVRVPPSVVEGLGRAGRIPVQAAFDGVAYRGSVVSMGDDGMVIGILKAILATLGKSAGDEVTVTLERDTSPRIVEVPVDLAIALKAAGLEDAFASLSFTRRNEIASAVTGAKKAETRQRRIDQAVAELADRS